MELQEVFDKQVILSCQMDNGYYVHTGDLMREVILFMIKRNFTFKYGTPFEVHINMATNTAVYSFNRNGFRLTKGEMLVITNWMFQKLLPGYSWKNGWKRNDGKHLAWLSTDDMKSLVTMDTRYTDIRDYLEFGHYIKDAKLVEFRFFRDYWERIGVMPSRDYIAKWVRWTYVTFELMRQLTWHGKARNVYEFKR